MDEVMIFWMVLLILCIGIEVLTLGLTTIWFAAGALVAIFAALLQAPIFLQVILFLLVSLLSLFFTRPIAIKYFNRDRVKTNVESMVGRQAIVTGEIDNLQAAGQVTVSGQEWSARSWDDKVKLPVGAVVVVTAISGVKLIVRMEQQVEESAGWKTVKAVEINQRPVQVIQKPVDMKQEAGQEMQGPADMEQEAEQGIPKAADISQNAKEESREPEQEVQKAVDMAQESGEETQKYADID